MQNCFTAPLYFRQNVLMKTLRNLLLVVLVGSVLSCTTQKSDSAASGSCPFPSNSLGRISSYGAFNTATFDQCEQFEGATSRWTGMDASVSSTAMIALPSAMFNSGAACGSCFRIEGASSTMIGRVITECPGCASDTVDMDDTSFTQISGQSVGSGFQNVTVTAIPCPSSENIKVIMNSSSNPYYFNILLADHVTPVKKLEVDIGQGSGYQDYPRGSDGAFALALGTSATSTASVRITDYFDQVVSGTFTTAASSTTTLGSQFGTCN